jgi:hypothetical protein
MFVICSAELLSDVGSFVEPTGKRFTLPAVLTGPSNEKTTAVQTAS